MYVLLMSILFVMYTVSIHSPLPDKLDFKRPKLDLSLNGSFISNDNIIKTQEKKVHIHNYSNNDDNIK